VVLRASNEFGFTEQSFTITVTDDIAPQISTLLPANNATDVSLQPTLTITFDEEVVLGDTGTLTVNNGNTVLRTYDLSLTEDRTELILSEESKALLVELDVELPINTVFTIDITPGFVSDMSENAFAGFEVSSETWSFTTINKLEQTINFPEISTKKYGDDTFILGDSQTERGLTVTYTAADSSIVRISGNQATILKVGATIIIATQPGDEFAFEAESVERTLKINQAPLIITTDDQSKVYDLDDPEFTYKVTGLIGSDKLSGKLSRESGEDVGMYAITLGTLTGGNNYQITYSSAQLEVLPTTIKEIFEIGTLEMNWGTVPDLPNRVMLMATNGKPYFLDVTWDQSPLNRFRRGNYKLIGQVKETSWIKNLDALQATIEVVVLPKSAPQEILLSNNTFDGANTSQEVKIGTLSVVDPIDNIQALGIPYGLEDNRYFRVVNDVLYWSSEDPAAGRSTFKIVVRVTDRDFNTLDKVFTIERSRKSVSSIEVFNTFSPDRDGMNDTWGVTELRYYSGVRIQIYERGGVRVFYTENPDVKWDGIYKNKEMPIGSYYWIIEVEETGETRRGIVNLFRN
jgi:gliding motility-associated-like protein